MFGFGILLGLIGLVGVFAGDTPTFGLVMIAIGGVLLFIDYMNYQQSQVNTNKPIYKKEYKNHCWYCGTRIDSNVNAKCNKCNKYYVCSNCGRCLCDSPKYER